MGHNRVASEMPFQWSFAGRPIIARLWLFFEPHPPPPPLKKTKQTKNKLIRVGPPLTKLSGSAHDVSYLLFGRNHTKFGIKIFTLTLSLKFIYI